MQNYPADYKLPLATFYHWEAQQPEKTFLVQCSVQGDQSYSYAECGRIARALAAGLQAQGLQPGDRVGVYSENTAKWILLDLALMMSGLVSVPIYATMPADKIAYIADHSEMRLMYVGDRCDMSPAETEAAFAGQFKVVGQGAGLEWADLLKEDAPLAGSPDWPFDQLWTISYTSGTTGKPKGVMHSFSTISFSAFVLTAVTRVNTDSRFFSYLPLAHIAERTVVEMQALYCGGMIGFNECLDTFTDDLRRIKPHYFNSVPRIWANLKAGVVAQMGKEKWAALQNDPALARQAGASVLESMGLGDCTWAQSGSAPISPGLIREWRNLGLPLFEGYGQSETMNGLFNSPDSNKIGTVGRAFNPEEARVSESGELLLKSLGNMLGYYKDPEKTRETIVDGWIRTGDKVKVDEDGFYTITGRVKEIFKTAKGKYVAPAPIEGEFSKLVGVGQACLIGRGMPQTVMLMVEDGAVKLSKEAIEANLRAVNERLESHEKISHVVVCKEAWTVENGLLTHTLKMLRDDIEARYQRLVDELGNSGSSESAVVYEAEREALSV